MRSTSHTLPGRSRKRTLYRVLAALLIVIAAALTWSHLGHLDPLNLKPAPRTILGILAGVGIGIVAALMGVAAVNY
jgi:hypothetical protein